MHKCEHPLDSHGLAAANDQTHEQQKRFMISHLVKLDLLHIASAKQNITQLHVSPSTSHRRLIAAMA